MRRRRIDRTAGTPAKWLARAVLPGGLDSLEHTPTDREVISIRTVLEAWQHVDCAGRIPGNSAILAKVAAPWQRRMIRIANRKIPPIHPNGRIRIGDAPISIDAPSILEIPYEE